MAMLAAGLVAVTMPAAAPAFADTRTSVTTGPDVIRNEMLRWTGRKWFLVPVPEPAGTAADSVNELLADRCISASDCWAVGATQRFAEPYVKQILHWTGRKWLTTS
jgi:hypothetical protein